MDDFSNLARDLGFLPQKYAPIKSGGHRPPSVTNNNLKSTSDMAHFDYDATFKKSVSNAEVKSKTTSLNVPVFDDNDNDDIFDGLPGLKSKSMSSFASSNSEENVFASVSESQSKRSQQSDDFDDLTPGFVSGSGVLRSNLDLRKSTVNTKKTSNAVDDPFVVLESTSGAANSYQSFSADPLDNIGNVSNSGIPKSGRSSVSGIIFNDIDPLNDFGESAPAVISEVNNMVKDQSPPKDGPGMGRARSSISKDSTQKASFRYSERQAPVDNFQESHQTVYGVPEVSRNHNSSFDQSTCPPSYTETNSQMGQEADEIWLTVSEIPLFTKPTRALPPSRPPPPIPKHSSKSERGSLRSNSRKVVNGVSSPKYYTTRMPNDRGAYADTQSAGQMDSILASASMKEAMDRAEAKFRHAKEVRESKQPDRDDQREKEEEEREQRRLEKERMREVERENARQAVERATREARERAAFEAREKASAEARLKSERAAVQRAQAEARERAEEETRRRAERAALERVAAEARKRAAVEARDREAFSRTNQQKNDNDLEFLFSTGTRPSSAPRPRETSSDSASDPLSLNRRGPEGSHRTSTSGVSSNMRKASSTTNIVDDLSSIFGAAPQFQEVEGETEERRRARLEREQRIQERAAKALAEKNQRDLQSQREQEERHRFGGTLDTEVKRWAAGREGNLRALLSTLQFILWPECGWQPLSLTDLITGANVKKAYRKATLCIHPDKVQQKGANLQQKYVAEKVFDILKEAWNKFNSEELF